MVLERNANKPATKRQLFALFLASKAAGRTHDYREDGLTMQQASELLVKFNGTKVSMQINKSAKPKRKVSADEQLKSDFREYVENHYVNAAVSTLERVLKQVSIVADDPATTKKPKQYIFFGSGCSVGWLTWDKRNKKGEKIQKLSYEMHRYAISLVAAKLGRKKVNDLQRMGAPIGAILSQDYEMNQLWLHIERGFMEKCGVKNIQTHIHYD